MKIEILQICVSFFVSLSILFSSLSRRIL